MEQTLTPAQIEVLRQQKIQRFKSMGLPANVGQIVDVPVENMPEARNYSAPAPPQVIAEVEQPQYNEPQQQESYDSSNDAVVAQRIKEQISEERAQRQNAMYTAPRERFNALEAIRKGAKKQEFTTFIKAEKVGVNGNQLPEPKVGKRKPTRGQPLQEKSQGAVAPQTFNTPKSTEAEDLENLFTDKSSGINVRSSGSVQGTLIEHNNDYSNIGGPAFDPAAHLRKKAEEKGMSPILPQKQPANQQVFQTENSGQISQLMLMMENVMKGQQKNPQYNLKDLTETMELIAKKVAEDTIKKVLKEYVDGQKKKNLFEVVNKEKNIIKIGESYYHIKKVVPTQNS